jgi:membrane-associated phospholipid phosphatase
MAAKIELLNRVETQKGVFAVEKVALIYNLLTSILILYLYQRMDHPIQMLWERLAIFGVTLLLIYLYRLFPYKYIAFIRISFQMGLLSYWYPDTFEFNRFLPNLDYLFAGIDQNFFGCQPALMFCKTLSYNWASEAFNLGYFSYYPMIFIVCLFYFIKKYDLFEKLSFVIVTSFFIYYLIYIFVPVSGPQFYYPAIGMDNVAKGIFPHLGDYFNYHQELLPGPNIAHGFFYNLVEDSQQIGERPTAAFPSSHVGISTILMIFAWRGSKKLFTCLAPLYLLLCGATVFIQAHYLIDAISGFITAFLIFYIVCLMYKYWFAYPIFAPRKISSSGGETTH